MSIHTAAERKTTLKKILLSSGLAAALKLDGVLIEMQMIKPCTVSNKSETLEEGSANLASKLETSVKESRVNSFYSVAVENHLSVIGLCLHTLKNWQGYFWQRTLSRSSGGQPAALAKARDGVFGIFCFFCFLFLVGWVSGTLLASN